MANNGGIFLFSRWLGDISLTSSLFSRLFVIHFVLSIVRSYTPELTNKTVGVGLICKSSVFSFHLVAKAVVITKCPPAEFPEATILVVSMLYNLAFFLNHLMADLASITDSNGKVLWRLAVLYSTAT